MVNGTERASAQAGSLLGTATLVLRHVLLGLHKKSKKKSKCIRQTNYKVERGLNNIHI